MQSLGDMRAQLDDLQRQLGTGKKSTTYAGLGTDRGLMVGLRSQLSAMTGYADTITNVGMRISLQQNALTGIAKMASSVKGAAQTQFNIDASGQAAAQRTASGSSIRSSACSTPRPATAICFPGARPTRRRSRPPITSSTATARAPGFKQVLAERNQADLGANGLGRLVIPPAAGSQVSVSEDIAGSVFGFKLAGVNSTLTGATVTGPTGSPPGITVNLHQQSESRAMPSRSRSRCPTARARSSP